MILMVVLTISFISSIWYTKNIQAQNKQLNFEFSDNRLIIIQLLSGITSATGGKTGPWWSSSAVYHEDYLPVYAVIHGTPPYKWSIDNPNIASLKPIYKGIAVEVYPKKEGKTILRVTDKNGLRGEVLIQTFYHDLQLKGE